MNRANAKPSYERANERTATVQGEAFTVWDNYLYRGTFAQNEACEVRQIKSNGYVSSDLNVRKAIAAAFDLKGSRK